MSRNLRRAEFGGEAFKAATHHFTHHTLVAFSVNQNQDWEQSSRVARMNVVADKIGTGAFAEARAWSASATTTARRAHHRLLLLE